MDLSKLKTEARNEATMRIDSMGTLEMLKVVNDEDRKVAEAVGRELESIAKVVDLVTDHLKKGGRLIYCGCGTSGRLGILDAVECPPTFSTDPEQIVGLIAGGYEAIFKAKEGAEDSYSLGEADLEALDFNSKDVLVGIAASGRTPYVLGAMAYAKRMGGGVVGVSCNPGSPIEMAADYPVTVTPGPEVVTGSTRLKSGTAQKMVLNMISTCSMIKLGKVYGNLMVDVKPSNEKLVERCKRIVSEATGCSYSESEAALEKCSYRPKVAIVMIKKGVDAEEAVKLLSENDDRIAPALGE